MGLEILAITFDFGTSYSAYGTTSAAAFPMSAKLKITAIKNVPRETSFLSFMILIDVSRYSVITNPGMLKSCLIGKDGILLQ